MTKEKLVNAGFSSEQAENILKMYKEAIDGQFVPKHRFDEINGELKTAKEQIADRDNQIAGLKKFEGDSKALNDRIAELEKANKDKDAEYSKTLSIERKKNAVRLALLEDESGKPHDADMVMGLFNLDNIQVDEATGKITSGYKEQNDSIRKEKTFLFEAKPDPTKPKGWNPRGGDPKDGDKGGQVDTAESYGKSLAQIKLGMMGIDANSNSNSQNSN